MDTRIAEELESETLHRFHADFRRALLMHRKAALNLFFRLQFPLAEEPLYEGIGAAEAAGHEEVQTIIERADAALYRAKQAGRNRVDLHDPRIT